MLTEINDKFWIDLEKVLLISKDKENDEWHVYFATDLQLSHLILDELVARQILEIIKQNKNMDENFVPLTSTCL